MMDERDSGLAREISIPLEVLANTLYLMRHTRPSPKTELLDAADHALAMIRTTIYKGFEGSSDG